MFIHNQRCVSLGGAAVIYRKDEVLTTHNIMPYDLGFIHGLFLAATWTHNWLQPLGAELGPPKIHTLEAPTLSASESNHTWTWGL